MGDSSYPAPSILDGYISEADLARQLNRSVRTLQRLAARRLGPPRTIVGRLIFYNIEHACLGSRSPLRFQFCAPWAARAPSTAARSESPCWPLPLRVTARSFAQPLVAAL